MPHGHYKTVTLVAGVRLRGLVAQKVFDRPINAALFEEWVETCLVPTLSKGDVVVMDNLPAHKGPRVEKLIKAVGAELRYLPPYSPDMNPIEKAFSKLKAFLRKIAERTVAGLMRALEACADIFKPAECTNYFAACGYHSNLIGYRSRLGSQDYAKATIPPPLRLRSIPLKSLIVHIPVAGRKRP